MTDGISAADRRALEGIVGTLAAAWNANEGAAFAAPFAPDADLVNIRAEHHQGREAITAGHTAIFRTIYTGSSARHTMQSDVDNPATQGDTRSRLSQLPQPNGIVTHVSIDFERESLETVLECAGHDHASPSPGRVRFGESGSDSN